jgi:hypothetical protein
LTNVVAAFCAARSRSGLTSLACIEREWSVTSMTEARSTATSTGRCGLAIATTSAASAASARAAGSQRRQAGAPPAAALTVASAGKRTA